MATIDGAWGAVEEAGSRLLVRWGGAGFDEIKADFRRRFPRHRDAVYLPEQRAWSVPREHMRRLEAWLALWFDDDAIAWERPSPPPPTRATVAAPLAPAYAALCLTEAAPAELVEAAHRILAKRHHPDHGGDHETMVTLNHAIEVIRAHQQ